MTSNQKLITICPKCKKSNYSIEANTSFIGGNSGWYHCNSCGFESAIFPSIDEDKVSKTKINLKERKAPTKNEKVLELHQIPIVIFVIIFGALATPFLYLWKKLK
jgi:hypothetical protein